MKLYESKYLDVELPASVERAWLVAQAANKHLVILTGDKLFLKFLDHESRPHRFIEQPCPCGYFGTEYKQCKCSPSRIEKHQAKLHKRFSDCIWVDGYISSRSVKFKNLDGASQQLIEHAWQELRLAADEITTMLEIAEAIAKRDNSKVIRPEHIAEAISYRAK